MSNVEGPTNGFTKVRTMPELPDVENFRRGLRRRASHRRIEQVHVRDTRVLNHLSARKLAHAAENKQVGTTRRHGKHLFIALEGRDEKAAETDRGPWLHVHFGMTGHLAHFQSLDDDPKHDRVRFDLTGDRHLAFVDQRRFGRIGLVDDPEEFIEHEKLGPDALSPALDRAALRAALRGKRSIKAALMDQRSIAGIGNVYADEILFQAKLDPRRSPDALEDHEVARLHRQIGQVLREAIAHGAGSDALLERVERKTWLLPHREEGAKCPRCRGTIRAYSTGGRRGYFCPACQK